MQVAGNAAGLPAVTLNTCAALYLAFRFIYNALYIYGPAVPMNLGKTRGIWWFAGVVTCFTLISKAASRFA